jgi:peptidyl-prolyl cis-trans isomerase C
MNTVLQDTAQGYRYHLLRNALERFSRNLAQLDEQELDEARRRADRTWDLESLVLTSAEAREVCIPPQQVDTAFAAVASRYPDRAAFEADLRSNGLDEELLRAALRRELVFDSVLLRVAAGRPAVSQIDARLYYELHPERFAVPEQRQARQILVTINDDFADNHRVTAWSRIRRIEETLRHSPRRFAALARRHSECPSALDGGRLGTIRRGQLYPELDSALFSLQEGTITRIIETGLGLHLLLCEKVMPARGIPFARAESRIREHLDARNRRNCQKAWLRTLRQTHERRYGDE